jgi:hypothetical protein
MPTFQIISWDAGDEETDDGLEYRITMYGRTQDGKSIAVMCPFEPFWKADACPATRTCSRPSFQTSTRELWPPVLTQLLRTTNTWTRCTFPHAPHPRQPRRGLCMQGSGSH